MRSPALRLTLATVAWLALGVAAFFVIQSERHVNSRRAAARAFDQQARELSDLLSRARAAQQAYVAEGQGAGFWMPEFVKLAEGAAAGLTSLRENAFTPEAAAGIDEARTGLGTFGDVDRRARDYLDSGQMLMAADVIFTEGGTSVTGVSRQVQAAALTEQQAADTFEAGQRKQQAMALAGAAGATALVLALLAFGRPRERSAAETDATDGQVTLAIGAPSQAATSELELNRPAAPLDDDPALSLAAGICTDLGRISHSDALPALLERAADTMGATSLILWMGDAAGAELKPALAHGYTAQTLARMRPIPRLADNAVATAYRTGTLQTVAARTIGAPGAIITPLLTQAGCVGALTAEVPIGVESSERAQALCGLFAAQLATILGPAPAESGANPARTATA